MRILSQNTCMYMKTQNRERFENYHLFWLVVDEGEGKKRSIKIRILRERGFEASENKMKIHSDFEKLRYQFEDIHSIGNLQTLALYSVSCKLNILHQLTYK